MACANAHRRAGVIGLIGLTEKSGTAWRIAATGCRLINQGCDVPAGP